VLIGGNGEIGNIVCEKTTGEKGKKREKEENGKYPHDNWPHHRQEQGMSKKGRGGSSSRWKNSNRGKRKDYQENPRKRTDERARKHNIRPPAGGNDLQHE